MTDQDPDWENLARDRLAGEIERRLDDDLIPAVRNIIDAIEDGEDAEEAFWDMMDDVTFFYHQTATELQKTGDLGSDDPAMRLFSQGRLLQELLMLLGQDIEAETVGEGRLDQTTHSGSGLSEDFDTVREHLDRTRDVVNEIEQEYANRSSHSEQSEGDSSEVESTGRDVESKKRPDILWKTKVGRTPMRPSQWAQNVLDENYREGSEVIYRGLVLEYVDEEAGLWEVSREYEDKILDGIDTTSCDSVDEILARLDRVADEYGGEPHRKAWPEITIEDGLVQVEQYPRSGSASLGTLTMHTRDDRIYLGAAIDDQNRVAKAGFTIEPDTAEWLAETLPEFAAKARAGEDWVFKP